MTPKHSPCAHCDAQTAQTPDACACCDYNCGGFTDDLEVLEPPDLYCAACDVANYPESTRCICCGASLTTAED